MTEFKSFSPPKILKTEIMRYMNYDQNNEIMLDKIDKALREAADVLQYNVCFCKLKFTISDDFCDFGVFSCRSRALARALLGFDFAMLFLASIGHGIDRLISRYSRTSPSMALVMQAVGTERVEALANEFSKELSSLYGNTSQRFSPGYGDLPLDVQKNIFELLSPQSKMGVYLSDKCIMSPSKSVTAFVGVKNSGEKAFPKGMIK